MSQDTQARKEIQNLYSVLVTLSETVKTQQERIDQLEKKIGETELVAVEEERTETPEVNIDKEDGEFRIGGVKFTEVEKELPCPLCGEEFTMEAMSHHFNSSDDHPALNEVFKTDEETWECPECGTELSSKETLYKHGRRQHDLNMTELMFFNQKTLFKDEELEPEFGCPICGDSFDSQKQLITHINKKPDHDTISDHFKLGNGRFHNPELDEYYVDYTKFHNSWLKTSYNMSGYFLENYGELPTQT